MLALSRKSNESIIIGHDVEITILEIKGDQVKLGINAPKSVPVYRKEIYLQIQEANKEAVAGGASLETLKNIFLTGKDKDIKKMRFVFFFFPKYYKVYAEKVRYKY